MIAGAIVALAAAAAVFVLAPLRRPAAPPPAGDAEEERLRRKEAALAQVRRDIELDHDTGKLSAEDYAELRARYGAQAEAGTDAS